MKKLVFPIIQIYLLVFSLVFTSCDNGEDSTSFNRSEILIGIAMPDTSAERWTKDGNALKNAALELGYKVELVFADGNQSDQNTKIQALITQGVKLLILTNIDTGITPVVTEAKNKGITIIAYDRLILDTGDYDYYITFNNDKVGQMQGQVIVDALDLTTPKNIALFAGAPSDNNAKFFFNGAMKILEPYIESNMLVPIEGSNFLDTVIEFWWPDGDHDRMDTIFNGSSSIDAVLAPNDYIARYIINNYFSSKTIPVITGQDAEFESAKYIKSGKQTMTVFKDTISFAKNAISIADQILEGKAINISGIILATGALEEMGDTGVKTVKTYLMDPKVINQNNLQDLIDTDWFTPEQKEELE